MILRPSVQKRHRVLEEPTLEDQRPDLRRVLDGRRPGARRVDRGAAVARSGAAVAVFDVTAVVVDEELIDVEPGDTTARRYAIAFDLGTTTVVATLWIWIAGKPLAVRSMLNRQQPFGADVITRISATMMDPTALGALRARRRDACRARRRGLRRCGVESREVYEITVCGNQTMMQLALGIDPEPLSMAPFVVTTNSFPEGSRATSGSRCTRARRRSCSRRSARTSAATSSPACCRRG